MLDAQRKRTKEQEGIQARKKTMLAALTLALVIGGADNSGPANPLPAGGVANGRPGLAPPARKALHPR
jgi:hypothetical protein